MFGLGITEDESTLMEDRSQVESDEGGAPARDETSEDSDSAEGKEESSQQEEEDDEEDEIVPNPTISKRVKRRTGRIKKITGTEEKTHSSER